MKQKQPSIRTVSLFACAAMLAYLPATHRTRAAELDPRPSILRWREANPIPNPVGLAGMFAGTSHGKIIAAGGANFPEKPPWEDGTKIWHDSIYVFDLSSGQWQQIDQSLPSPIAYGVSVSYMDSVICIGGDDGQRTFRDVFQMQWIDDELRISSLPPLPEPRTQLAGSLVGDVVYIAGGIDEVSATTASDSLWSLNLADESPEWVARPALPSPRMQAVGGAFGASFFVFGGVQLRSSADGQPERITPYLNDAWSFEPTSETWTQRADLPYPVAAAPSPAFAAGQTHLLLLGGVDGSLFEADPKTHPGFPTRVLLYNPITDRWVETKPMPEDSSRVTVPCVSDGKRGFVVSGESRPGIRSPKVFEFSVEHSGTAFGAVNWSILIAYLVCLVAIGIYFASRENTTDDFFLAGRRVPWWAAGLSVFATMLSAITYLAIPARAYGTNWTYIVINAGILAVAPIVIYIYLPFYRRLEITSAYEYLERRFSLGIRLLGSCSFIVFQLARMGVVVLLPALALSAVTGLNVYTCILAMGILSTLYTVLGGIEAVVWTDVLQTLVLIGGAIAALIVMASGIEGGISTIYTAALEQGKFQMINPTWDWLSDGLPVILLAAVFNNLVSYSTDQAVIQRYLTTADQKQAGRAIWTNAWLAVPASLLFFFVGTGLFIFYQTMPEKLPPLEQTDQVFAWFIAREMPAGLAGLVIAGVFAAAMSSLDSSIHSVATAITTDFVRRFSENQDEKRLLMIARVLTVVLGVAGTVSASLMAGRDIQYLFTFFLGLVGLFGGTLCGLFMLGIFTRTTTSRHAWIGIVFSLAALLIARYQFSVNGLLYSAIGATVCFATGYVASLLVPSQQHDIRGLSL